MSELQQYYDAVCRGYWKSPDPAECGCRGCGWFSSEVDTWHRCSYHYDPRAGHPDDPGPDHDNPVGLNGPYYIPHLAGFSGPVYDHSLRPLQPVGEIWADDEILF